MLKGENIYFIYICLTIKRYSFKKDKFWEQEIEVASHNVSSVSKVTIQVLGEIPF